MSRHQPSFGELLSAEGFSSFLIFRYPMMIKIRPIRKIASFLFAMPQAKAHTPPVHRIVMKDFFFESFISCYWSGRPQLSEYILSVKFQLLDGLSDVVQGQMGVLFFERGQGRVPPFHEFFDRADINITVVQQRFQLGHIP